MNTLIVHLTHYSVKLPPLYYGGSERVAWWLALRQSLFKPYIKQILSSDAVIIALIGCFNDTLVNYCDGRKLDDLLLFDACILKPYRSSFADYRYMLNLAKYVHLLTEIFGVDRVIVHNHVLQRNSWLILPVFLKLFKTLSNKKVDIIHVLTLHYDPPTSKLLACLDHLIYSLRSSLIAISKSQFIRLRSLFKRSLITYVYNGLPIENYPFSRDKEDYYLYLGAITPSKGPHIAVMLAKKLNIRLYIAGPIRNYTYFNTFIKPFLNSNIKYLGEVDEKVKLRLLSKAKALIFPVQREEYFGLVAVEAMACGTPVITFARGAMPEIITHRVTGFLARNMYEMFKYIKDVNSIDPIACRKHVEEKFSSKHMCLRYVTLYAKLMDLWDNQKGLDKRKTKEDYCI